MAALLVSVVLAAASGCVYTRLLETKRQLSHFDEYFTLGGGPSLTILFKKPVLLESDVVWITKAGPTSRTESEGGTVSIYRYVKRYRDERVGKAERGRYDITVRMVFVERRLKEVSFPPRFRKAVSTLFLAAMFNSLGEAKVKKLSKSAESALPASAAYRIPTRRDIVWLLGRPYGERRRKGEIELLYAYDVEGSPPTSSPAGGDSHHLELAFTVAEEGDKITRARLKIGGFKLDIAFPRRSAAIEGTLRERAPNASLNRQPASTSSRPRRSR